ncbi:hypothetical protein EV356DRAFT_260945 [Viridothelium virens]|uniref:Uncharacterized protein n=1 Tax=Viridothelium virens TaxID=1048519 RepID=A0A6A6H1Z2_VIRVR|nr:hypothetical protein EV356DRAFT_260945 [Viridothelium virens]
MPLGSAMTTLSSFAGPIFEIPQHPSKPLLLPIYKGCSVSLSSLGFLLAMVTCVVLPYRVQNFSSVSQRPMLLQPGLSEKDLQAKAHLWILHEAQRLHSNMGQVESVSTQPYNQLYHLFTSPSFQTSDNQSLQCAVAPLSVEVFYYVMSVQPFRIGKG